MTGRITIVRLETYLDNKLLTAIPRQQWLRERASLLRLYIHCLSC